MIYFCVGYSKSWSTPIYKIIDWVKKKKYNLSWLRVGMSYHRYTNLREIFQEDMADKLIRGVESKDFQIKGCNWQGRKTSGCNYDNVCQMNCVVYKVECTNTKLHWQYSIILQSQNVTTYNRCQKLAWKR